MSRKCYNNMRRGNENKRGMMTYGSFYRKKDINFTKQEKFREYEIR